MVRMATGIPPRLHAMGLIQNLTELIKQDREDRLKHYKKIKVVIAETIEEKTEANGQITCPSVIKMFNELSKFETAILVKLDLVFCVVHNRNKECRDTEEGNDGLENMSVKIGPKGHVWSYREKFWSVHQSFELPKKVQKRRG